MGQPSRRWADPVVGVRRGEPVMRVWGMIGDENPLHGSEPVRPWAAVWHEHGLIHAKAGRALASGIFWTLDSKTGLLHVGPGLGEVVQARREVTVIDPVFIRGWLGAGPLAHTGTPYRGVFRLPAGATLTWDGRGDPIVNGAYPSERPPPMDLDDRDVVQQYREEFDRVVDQLLLPDEPLCATLSGGLDSAFVVASLVLHAGDRGPVHAFNHSPLAAADLHPVGSWDPDDFDVAATMLQRYPDRISLSRVRNESMVEPLDVAVVRSQRSWMPVFAPANEVWLSAIAQRARMLGATQLFIGSGGNPAFSPNPRYAPAHYLRRADLPAVWRLTDPLDGGGRGSALLTNVIRPLASPLRRQRSQGAPSWLPRASRPSGDGRVQHLRWLLDSPLRMAVVAPGVHDVEIVDPFNTAPMLDLAARISPLQWARYSMRRGFARHVAEGRLPDAIRLRSRRGGQSWDNWYWVHERRDRYLDEVSALASTPILPDLVDVAAVRSQVHAFPWGSPSPTPRDLQSVQRLLALAAFVRMTQRRLQSLG